MAITVATLYALDMPKYIYVQLYSSKGAPAPPPLRIRADKIEKQEHGSVVLKLGAETVGEFNTAIHGWWIQDEP